MRTILSSIGVVAIGVSMAVAQTQPAPQPSPAPAMAAAPLPGANSFTRKEAENRIVKAGYENVSGLTKDDRGIWRGTAMKGGKSVKISLDYKGNVVED